MVCKVLGMLMAVALVAAVKAAGLVETLLMPANKAMLAGVLTDHVVAGSMDTKALKAKAKNGKVELTTPFQSIVIRGA